MIYTDGRPTIAWAPLDGILSAPPAQDINVRNEGSVVLLVPKNKIADTWLRDNLADDVMTFAGAYCVEPRYVEPIIDGAVEAGLHVGASW